MSERSRCPKLSRERRGRVASNEVAIRKRHSLLRAWEALLRISILSWKKQAATGRFEGKCNASPWFWWSAVWERGWEDKDGGWQTNLPNIRIFGREWGEEGRVLKERSLEWTIGQHQKIEDDYIGFWKSIQQLSTASTVHRESCLLNTRAPGKAGPWDRHWKQCSHSCFYCSILISPLIVVIKVIMCLNNIIA